MPHTSFTKASLLSINNSSFTHIAGNQYNYNYTIDETAAAFPASRRRKHGRSHGPTSTALDAKEGSPMQKSTAPEHNQSPGGSAFEVAVVPSGAPGPSELRCPSPSPSRPRSSPGVASVTRSPAPDASHCSLRPSTAIYASNPRIPSPPPSWNSNLANMPYSPSRDNWGKTNGASVLPQAPFVSNNASGTDQHQSRQGAWTNGNTGGWYTMDGHWNTAAPTSPATSPAIYAQLYTQTYSYNPNVCQDQHARHSCGFWGPENLYQQNGNGCYPQPVRRAVSDDGIFPPSHRVNTNSELQGSWIRPAPPPHPAQVEGSPDVQMGGMQE